MDEKQTDKPEEGDRKAKEPVKVTFSLAQLTGSAAAAATAAYLGSTLGTAGTIIGAALASVVGAVAGTVYTAGLDRTGRRLGSVMQRGWDRVRGADPSAELDGDGLDLVLEETDPGTMAPVPVGPVHTAEARHRTWKAVGLRVGLAAVAIFAVTFAAITVLELVGGRTLDGRPGTTVSQVVKPEPAEPSESDEPEPTPSESETVLPSESPSVSAEPTPSATVTAPTPTGTASVPAPTASGEPSQQPSSEPATPATPATSEEPATEAPAGPVESAPPEETAG